MKTKYSLEIPGAIKALPNEYKNIVEVYGIILRLFRRSKFHFVIIKCNGEFFRKVINPRYRKVTDEEFLKAHNTGLFSDAFILNEFGEKQYYIKD
jgi:hypothetical protein